MGANLVLDIRHVHHKVDLVAEIVPQDPPNHILREVVSTKDIAVSTESSTMTGRPTYLA